MSQSDSPSHVCAYLVGSMAGGSLLGGIGLLGGGRHDSGLGICCGKLGCFGGGRTKAEVDEEVYGRLGIDITERIERESIGAQGACEGWAGLFIYRAGGGAQSVSNVWLPVLRRRLRQQPAHPPPPTTTTNTTTTHLTRRAHVVVPSFPPASFPHSFLPSSSLPSFPLFYLPMVLIVVLSLGLDNRSCSYLLNCISVNRAGWQLVDDTCRSSPLLSLSRPSWTWRLSQ